MGNSHTYRPKELGGIPGAFKKLARACTQEVTLASRFLEPHSFYCVFFVAVRCSMERDVNNLRSTFDVTQGGADLVDLWDEFEQYIQRSSFLAARHQPDCPN